MVALILMVMGVQSVFPMSEYKLRKLLYCKIWTVFDQALYFQTQALFLKIVAW